MINYVVQHSIEKKTHKIKKFLNKRLSLPSMFEHFYENKEIELQTIYKLHLMLIDYPVLQ
jgi:hypothetical protein